MPTMLLPDETYLDWVLEDRRERGIDDHDEVWDGVYVVMPIANNEHQIIGGRLSLAYGFVTDFDHGDRCLPGANVSDREVDWTKNYRAPDFLIYLAGNRAENRSSHWLGGPDLAVEVVSPNDRSRDKLDFYASVGTRELVVLDRDPWRVEVYRLLDGRLCPAETASKTGESVRTTTVPAEWHLVSLDGSPHVEIDAGGRRTALD